MTPFWLALVLLAQHNQPAEQKKVLAVVAQIRRLAASEPVVYGIDSRIRTSEVLSGKYPKVAKDFLLDADAAAGGVNSPAEQDALRVRIVDAMAPLDFDEAEHIIGSIHRNREEDFVAQAYDRLVAAVAKEHGDTADVISRGLHAGGFRSASAQRKLEELTTAHAAATELFAEILGAFPPEPRSDRDVYYLLECTKQIAGFNHALAVEALEKALEAATSDKLRITAHDKEGRKTVRRNLLREIARVLGDIEPELLEQYKVENKDLAAAAIPPQQPEPEQKQELNMPDFGAMSYVDALMAARKLEDPGARAAAYIEISRRGEITSQQRSSVASEALSAAGKMPVTNDRLLILAMISRDFARNNEPANAAFAAQLLSETYGKACECGGATCEAPDHDTFDCLGMVQDFAKYLDEFKISPEAMNLDNISLEVRLLILKLYPLLGLKTPSLWL